MPISANWLDEIVVMNESKEERVPGDVTLHRNEAEACYGLEEWGVENGETHAFTASGMRLVLGLDAFGKPFICRREECAEGPEIVLDWLRHLGLAVLEARRHHALKGRAFLTNAEEEGSLPDSVEGLILYAGLPMIEPFNWFGPGCLLLMIANAVFLIVMLFS